MNKFIGAVLALSSLFACTSSEGQHTDHQVPETVKAAFTTQFPKAQGPKWELEDGKDHEVNFKQDGVAWSAKYAADATWLETEHEVKTEALPEAVRTAITTGYADHKVETAEVVETPQGTVYEVELEKGEHSVEVVLAADGKVLRTKEEGGETKDDEEDD